MGQGTSYFGVDFDDSPGIELPWRRSALSECSFYLCSNAFISGVFQMFDKKPFNTSVSSIHLPFNIFEFQTLLYSALCNKQLLFPKKFNSQYLLNLPQPTYNKTSINIQHLQNIQKEPYIIIRLKCGTYC